MSGEKINQITVVYELLEIPPSREEEYMTPQGEIVVRSGRNDAQYQQYPAVRRLKIPVPGKHINKAGSEITITEVALTKNNRWRFTCVGSAGVTFSGDLALYFMWRERETTSTVTSTVKCYMVIRDTTQLIFLHAHEALDEIKQRGGRLVPLSGTDQYMATL